MAKNSFAAAASGQNTFTRKFGTNGNSVEPYVTGFPFIKWAKIPKLDTVLYDINSNAALASEFEMVSILESMCQSVTIPSKTVQTLEIQGLGGITWTAPSGVTQDSSVSMRFLELGGTPVHSIFRSWVRLVRDVRFGVSPLNGASGTPTEYSKRNYAGSFFYWTTKPDGVTIEYSAFFTGVYPKVDPSNQFGHDIADNNRLDLDIDFAFDYCWEQQWIQDVCSGYAASRAANAINTVKTDYSEEV